MRLRYSLSIPINVLGSDIGIVCNRMEGEVDGARPRLKFFSSRSRALHQIYFDFRMASPKAKPQDLLYEESSLAVESQGTDAIVPTTGENNHTTSSLIHISLKIALY